MRVTRTWSSCQLCCAISSRPYDFYVQCSCDHTFCPQNSAKTLSTSRRGWACQPMKLHRRGKPALGCVGPRAMQLVCDVAHAAFPRVARARSRYFDNIYKRLAIFIVDTPPVCSPWRLSSRQAPPAWAHRPCPGISVARGGYLCSSCCRGLGGTPQSPNAFPQLPNCL